LPRPAPDRRKLLREADGGLKVHIPGWQKEQQATQFVSFSQTNRRNEAMAESKSQDAIALLKEDHRTVEKLFKDFESASGDGRKARLAQQICLELTVHATIEEEIFYPACEGKVDEDLLKESYVEHDAAKVMIAVIEAADGQSDEYFDSKVKVLQEEIEHHVEEEERRMEGLFAQARKADIDLDVLGEQLASRKQELTETYKASGLPKPQLTTMSDVSI
jgi:hemerythrin superfamily protein